jgi:hypothetical protein
MRDSIKNASMSDLKDFLESILKHSARIGEIAMKQVCAFYCFTSTFMRHLSLFAVKFLFNVSNVINSIGWPGMNKMLF